MVSSLGLCDAWQKNKYSNVTFHRALSQNRAKLLSHRIRKCRNVALPLSNVSQSLWLCDTKMSRLRNTAVEQNFEHFVGCMIKAVKLWSVSL